MNCRTASLIVLLLVVQAAAAQSLAVRRAVRLGRGMNVSYLENWWLGTKEKGYADFVKPAEAAKRERAFADIARAGFQSVRIPVVFGVWASLDKPYRWHARHDLATVDAFVQRALANRLQVIVDLHHVELDGETPGAATTERLVWLWREIAERYKNTDPERVYFELRNEPKEMTAAAWRAQAEALIKTVRAVAPRHTLVVGFHDWNSRAALLASPPFADENIIYTFHYYDPFIFTHQGATWAGPGLPELKGVPFPWSAENLIETPATAKGTWIENQIGNYSRDARADKIFADLQEAKNWSLKHGVPIFAGEFGSYNLRPSLADRCRHAAAVYAALGRLQIPNAWWEWDGGFTMFEKGTRKIAPCMREAFEAFEKTRAGVG